MLDPHPLVIRAFDLDPTAIGRAPERNPALGLRGARLLVEASGIFETQIRAVLRAAPHGNIRLMFPMIGGLEEFRAARIHVKAALRALRHRQVPFREVPVGAMLEVPSAAATADILAREAEFLSIGTNDLMQYLFGADRANERVAHFNDALHPALLRTVRFVTRVAHRSNTPLAVCGEVAVEPLVVPLLLGFGIRTFSMSPNAVPEVKAHDRRPRHPKGGGPRPAERPFDDRAPRSRPPPPSCRSRSPAVPVPADPVVRPPPEARAVVQAARAGGRGASGPSRLGQWKSRLGRAGGVRGIWGRNRRSTTRWTAPRPASIRPAAPRNERVRAR